MVRQLSLAVIVVAGCFSMAVACSGTPAAQQDAGSGGGTAAGGGTGGTGGGATGGGTGGGDVDAGTGGGAAGGGTGGGATGGGTGGGATGGGTGGGATGGGTGGGSAVDAGVPTVRFVSIGDTGKGNQGQLDVGNAVGAHCAARGCDFVVMNGDNFYPTGVTSTTDPQWQTAFVTPYASVNAPFYAVLGNHDYGGDGAGTEISKGDHQVAYSQVNPKWRMPATHYKWSLNGVDFFAADTNRSLFGLDSQVKSDFTAWLPASTATWKFVFGHHPYKSNGRHGNAGRYDETCIGSFCVPPPWPANGAGVKSFLEAHVCGKADFYVCGHDHNTQDLVPTCSGTQLLVTGGAASTTPLEVRNPFHGQTDALAFAYFVVQGRTVTITFHDTTGATLHTRTVTK